MESGIREVEDNAEATEAWNGPLYEVWIKYRELVADGLREHGENAIRLTPPAEGDRVLDIGCGLGDTTTRLAEIVGEDGSAHGVDVAERMIETAIDEARESGAQNVTFAVQDVETEPFDREFDYAFARFGTMFFANPVAALRNVRAGACARRRPEHGGLAPQARQRHDAPRRAGRRRVPGGARGIRRAEDADRGRSRWRTRTR